MTSQQERFLELRAQGASYRNIAFALRVSERTLSYWKDKLESEVHWEETVQLEELQHELLGTRGLRARRLPQRLEQVEEELDKRSLADLSTARLFSLANGLRREIIQVTTPDKPLCTSSKNREPKSTPLDSATEEQSEADSPVEAPEADCNHKAIAVQPDPKADQDSLTPIQHETKGLEVRASFQQPTQHSSENCNDTAINLEHEAAAPLKANSSAEPEADSKNQPASTDPAPVSPSDVANHAPSEATQGQCKNSPSSGRFSSSSSTPAARNPIHGMPLSPERLIGNNISFREVLAKRGQAAQSPKAL
ncbi:MAG: hypothetical protein JWM16_5453 [Verrucomicrobiales bacterium]|nr:hypothetical protein [Verrucomicrobiales bacterium]